jgi:hypothetical protein
MKINQERKYDAVDGRIVNRVTGKPIPDDEPIFILRAKDVRSTVALLAYQDMCEDETHKSIITQRIDDFACWQDENSEQVREPDSDPSCLKI